MRVYLGVLKSYGRSVVRCVSEEQAKMFMDAMWEQYPHLVKGIWREGQTNWGDCGYDKMGEICYKHRIMGSGDSVTYCQSTSTRSAKRDGYRIVEFTDLLYSDDFGELPSPEFDIKSFFEMG